MSKKATTSKGPRRTTKTTADLPPTINTSKLPDQLKELRLPTFRETHLATAEQADVIMAPSPDMFEIGVKVQVLKRGTFFAVRARKLHELYRAYDSLDELPAKEKARLEKDILRMSVSDAWRDTCKFWQERDPREIQKAEADPKHKMALVFRSYLGQASRWAISGVRDRR